MIDDLPSDEPLEVLVWTLARDAKDLRERVEFGVKVEQFEAEIFAAYDELGGVLSALRRARKAQWRDAE